jgi:serine/threonine protein kinase
MSMMTKTFFLFEIVVALRFLRDNSVVHVDLKPQNLLLKVVTDSVMQQQHFLVKLIDFGESYSSKMKEPTSIYLFL